MGMEDRDVPLLGLPGASEQMPAVLIPHCAMAKALGSVRLRLRCLVAAGASSLGLGRVRSIHVVYPPTSLFQKAPLLHCGSRSAGIKFSRMYFGSLDLTCRSRGPSVEVSRANSAHTQRKLLCGTGAFTIDRLTVEGMIRMHHAGSTEKHSRLHRSSSSSTGVCINRVSNTCSTSAYPQDEVHVCAAKAVLADLFCGENSEL